MHGARPCLSCRILAAVVVMVTGGPLGALAQPNPAGFVPGHLFFTAIHGCSIDLVDTALRELDPVTGETWTWQTQATGVRCEDGLRFTPNGRYLRIVDWGGRRVLDMDAAGQLVERYGALNGGPLAPSIGLIWDCNGNFGVIDQASFRLYWFPGDRLPATIGVQIGPGGFDRARDGTIFVASTSWRRIVPPNAETILVQYLPDAVALSVAIDENGDAYVAVRVANIGGRIYKYPRGDIASGLVLSSNIANANKMALHMGEHRRTLYLATSSDIWRVDRETGSMASLFHQPPETEVSLGYGLTSYDPPEPGDLNCDGWIDNFDIDPFILALVDPAAYDAQYFFCDRQFADLNGDGSADLFDIDPFISALLAPPTP